MYGKGYDKNLIIRLEPKAAPTFWFNGKGTMFYVWQTHITSLNSAGEP